MATQKPVKKTIKNNQAVTPTVEQNVQYDKKLCVSCPPEKALKSYRKFYSSKNKLHTDGYLPICKDCINEKCYDEKTDSIDTNELKNILRQMDLPYGSSIIQSAINQYNKKYEGRSVPKDNKKLIIGYYFQKIASLPQYKYLNWEDGVALEKSFGVNLINNENVVKEIKYFQKDDKNDDPIYMLEDDDFTVTKDIISLFGAGYKLSEYKAMWDKYQFLKQSYPDVTNLHVESLITYVRFKVKEEFATARGDAAEADKWASNAMKAADKAKINPSQLSQSDLQGGLNSFSELLQAIEQAVDIIPILPQFKFRPNDAIDFNIWCLINYLRELEGKPRCSYEEVYKFYDERKAEYIAQYGDPYGIFKGDTTESNRENIKKFITLPADYFEKDFNLDQDSIGGGSE